MYKDAIILASYNGSKFINEQMDSILNYAGVDVTLLYFDDNSNDNIYEKFLKFSMSLLNEIELKRKRYIPLIRFKKH